MSRRGLPLLAALAALLLAIGASSATAAAGAAHGYDLVATATTSSANIGSTPALRNDAANGSAGATSVVGSFLVATEDGTFLPDEYYDAKENGLAPGQSAPYSTYERFGSNGDLNQVTTYDQYGDRANQYDIGDGVRHGEGSHSFEYNENNPRQAPGGGIRGPHVPFQ